MSTCMYAYTQCECKAPFTKINILLNDHRTYILFIFEPRVFLNTDVHSYLSMLLDLTDTKAVVAMTAEFNWKRKANHASATNILAMVRPTDCLDNACTLCF